MVKLSIKEISIVAVFPAMMAATAGISIPMGSLPPITLQTFFVFMAGLVLGPKLGSISVFVYILMGAIGLPVFSQFRGGFDVIMSGSGGFIIGFMFGAIVIGKMKNIKIINKKNHYLFLVLLLGNGVIYMFGAAYISFLLNVSIISVLATFSPYLLGDIIKILGALYVYFRIREYNTYEGR
ncbi:MAG: biotin transporter BioY [Bacilli bacterium]|nr:biotin transporter BioY [Bacilli bacterium]